ncbi:hypothetical protein MACH16_30820 [Marinomonas pontica]|uniref:Methyl-accepting chemotaxis protein n=1 Tax=Marinomonas pontica TaxID=264739 RepID=A0ABN6WRU9_9GAMM|nr:hypothetical protein MACH16_30820 [Marinomonas pontica]
MLVNLSFKTKLLILLITAILGLVIVTFVAIGGLASQKEANNELRNLSKIQASNDHLSIQMLEIADGLRSISEENFQEYLATANQQIEQNATTITANIEQANSQDLKEAL